MYLSTPPLLFWRGPPQSNCPPDLVPFPVFIRERVRPKFKKERCFIVWRTVWCTIPPTLHNLKFKSGSSYSKAPRGLFVQVWEGRIFTAIAISPGLSSRQSLSRSTFRAGLNSPDKELRYHRTVIVTAAVHQILGPHLIQALRQGVSGDSKLLALGRCQPLYIIFRFSRDLCF